MARGRCPAEHIKKSSPKGEQPRACQFMSGDPWSDSRVQVRQTTNKVLAQGCGLVSDRYAAQRPLLPLGTAKTLEIPLWRFSRAIPQVNVCIVISHRAQAADQPEGAIEVNCRSNVIPHKITAQKMSLASVAKDLELLCGPSRRPARLRRHDAKGVSPERLNFYC